MRVVPRDEPERGLEHRLRFFAVAPGGLGVLREYRDHLEQASRGNAVDGDLTAETAREEGVELILRAGCHVDLRCSVRAAELARLGGCSPASERGDSNRR